MNELYYQKYLKYKSKYLNLVANIEEINNQEGGTLKYSKQYKITLMLKITNETFNTSITKRYESIKNLICNVESQEPHLTLFEININGEHSNVLNFLRTFKSNISLDTPTGKINYYFGSSFKINNLLTKIRNFKIGYLEGTEGYTVFENVNKYFFCKKFPLDSNTREIIKILQNEILTKLKNIFKVDSKSIVSEIDNIHDDKEIKIILVDGKEIFYYNKLYTNPTELHITIAKITKENWQKYSSFQKDRIHDMKEYFLKTCRQIILKQGFKNLMDMISTYSDNNWTIDRDIDIKISTIEPI